MILRPRPYLVMVLAALLGVLALRLAVAVAFDPFADFYFLTGLRTAEFRSVDQHAERKIKRRMIEDAAPDAIDVAVFGNSRAAGLDPLVLAPHAVNLAFSAARTDEITILLSRFKVRQPHARIMVALDFDQCFLVPDPNALYLDPAADSQAIQDAATRLLALETLENWVKAVAMSQSMPQWVTTRGNIVRLPITAAQAEARRKIDFDNYGDFFRSAAYRPACAADAQAIRAVDPNAVLFINPISTGMRATIASAGKLGHLDDWRRDLVRLGNVLDFSCSQDLRDGEFIDGHHYGTTIAGRMATDLAAFVGGRKLADACVLGGS
jgi:hypothetical protein